MSERANGLLQRLHLNQAGFLDSLAVSVLGSKNPFVFKFLAVAVLRFYAEGEAQTEILSNLKFSVADKIKFETAKFYYCAGDLPVASALLKGLVSKANTDWRVTYRAFALLALTSRRAGDEAAFEKYASLCLLANADYPLAAIA